MKCEVADCKDMTQRESVFCEKHRKELHDAFTVRRDLDR